MSTLDRNAPPKRPAPRWRPGRRDGGEDDRRSPAELIADGIPTGSIRRRDRTLRIALVAADVVAALAVAGVTAAWLGPSGPGATGLLLPVLVVIVHAMKGMYDRDERLINKSTLDEAPATFHAATLVTVIGFLLESALLRNPIGAKVVLATWMGLAVAVPAARVGARLLVRRLLSPERCLVVGDGEEGRRLVAKLTGEPGAKVDVVGIVGLRANAEPGSAQARLRRAAERTGVHRVVIAGGAGEPQELETIHSAKALGVKVSVVPRVLEVVGSSASYDYVDGLTMLGVPRFGLSAQSRVVKRVLDLAGAIVITLLAAPSMLAIAATIRLTSPGPALFRQTRIGRDGRAFGMLKFRSMQPGADRMKDALRHRNEAEGLFKIADDPRMTPIGRFLRRTSLDELPQLFNVLRGEMSLVGPRPLVPEEDRQIRGWHRRRLHLTPGMTGPWQVLGSARIPLRDMVAIDYLYVANWSLWGDLKILLRTMSAMAARRGR